MSQFKFMSASQQGGAGQGRGPGNAGGWPSTTGGKSGSNRSNAPSSGGKK